MNCSPTRHSSIQVVRLSPTPVHHVHPCSSLSRAPSIFCASSHIAVAPCSPVPTRSFYCYHFSLGRNVASLEASLECSIITVSSERVHSQTRPPLRHWNGFDNLRRRLDGRVPQVTGFGVRISFEHGRSKHLLNTCTFSVAERYFKMATTSKQSPSLPTSCGRARRTDRSQRYSATHVALPFDYRQGGRFLLATKILRSVRTLPRKPLHHPRRHHLSISLVECALLAESKLISIFCPFTHTRNELGCI